MTEILYGTSMQPGLAIAAAARLENNGGGVQTLSSERIRHLEARVKRMGGDELEPEQVVLVGERVPSKRDIDTIFGALEVVGIVAASSDLPIDAPECPIIIDLGDELLESIEEQDLLIVDGTRGRIYITPDAMTVAKFQGPINTTRRILLDDSHLPARTASTNMLVTVFGIAPSRDAIEQAMEFGADGIVITADNDFFICNAETCSAAYQKETLHAIAETIAGLPIFLQLPTDQLSLSVLSQASLDGPIHVVCDDPELCRDLQQQMRMIEMGFEDEEIDYASVYYQLLVPSLDDEVTMPETIDEFQGIVVVEGSTDAPMGTLMMLGGIAQHTGKTASLVLPIDAWDVALDRALAFGFTQIIVPAHLVSDVKDAIRAA